MVAAGVLAAAGLGGCGGPSPAARRATIPTTTTTSHATGSSPGGGSTPSASAPAPTPTTGPAPTWVARSVPAGVGLLQAVACPSPTTCLAVGGAGFGQGPGWIVASRDGGRSWQLLDTSAQVSLAAIACPSATVCTAVGGGADSSGQGFVPGALVTTDGGQRWSAETLPSSLGLVSGVACPSTTTCVAVGSSLARTVDGGASWTVEGLPSGLSYVDAVTCPSTTVCMVAGSGPGPGASSPAMDALSTDAGATWSSAVVAGGTSGLGPVSCADARHCVGLIESDATNSYGTGSPVVTSDGGASWSAGAGDVGQAVSCVADFCLSVGGRWQAATKTYPGDAFVSNDGGASWRPSPVSTPAALAGVSCRSSADCVAVGGVYPSGTPGAILTYQS